MYERPDNVISSSEQGNAVNVSTPSIPPGSSRNAISGGQPGDFQQVPHAFEGINMAESSIHHNFSHPPEEVPVMLAISKSQPGDSSTAISPRAAAVISTTTSPINETELWREHKEEYSEKLFSKIPTILQSVLQQQHRRQ